MWIIEIGLWVIRCDKKIINRASKYESGFKVG